MIIMRKRRGIRRFVSVILFLCLLSGFLSVTTVIVKAETWNGFDYVVLNNGTVEITQCRGVGNNITIPAVIDGRVVTSIGSYAFNSCSRLTSVVIPAEVTMLGREVFTACSPELALYGAVGSVAENYARENGIVFPANVNNKDNEEYDEEEELTPSLPKAGTTRTLSSGKYLITKSTESKKTVTYMKPVNAKKATVIIPDTVKINGSTYLVTEIAAGAFKNNGKVKSITVGKNIVKIGKEAFYGCKKLKFIYFKTQKLKNVGKNFLSNNKGKIKTPKGYKKKYEKLFKSAIAK